MKKTLALLAAAALATACAKDIDPNDVRIAMPKAAVVQIGTPQDSAGSALTVAEVGTHSEFATVSYWTALTFNGATWWTLTLLQIITAFPPTSCDADACVWGPWTGDDQLTWKLDVRRDGDGYVYALASHAAGVTAFTPILTGTAFPGADAHHGNGDFKLDFEAARTVDPTKEDRGVLSVDYDNRTSLQIGALFLGARNDDPENPGSEFIDIAYQFGATAAGGELQIMFETTDAVKNLSLRSRWLEGGAGRGDARYTEAGDQVEASQCWNGAAAGLDAWETVYERFQIGSSAPWTSGDVAGCGTFSAPLYSSLVLP